MTMMRVLGGAELGEFGGGRFKICVLLDGAGAGRAALVLRTAWFIR
jgi:hypothetical protein